MKFDKEVCKQAESRLNQVLFEAEVKRLIRQEVDKFMAANLLSPPVKLRRDHLKASFLPESRNSGMRAPQPAS
jgi:hypothetical protein